MGCAKPDTQKFVIARVAGLAPNCCESERKAVCNFDETERGKTNRLDNKPCLDDFGLGSKFEIRPVGRGIKLITLKSIL